MLTYFLSQSNSYTIRTDVTSSNEYTMSLQNMYTLENTVATLTSASYSGYESYLSFTASISGASTATEYRATLINSGSTTPIWYGSLQVYSQSVDVKSQYENQNTQYISHISENRYIILD